MSNITTVTGDPTVEAYVDVDTNHLVELLYLIASDTCCIQLTTSDSESAVAIGFCAKVGGTIETDGEHDCSTISFTREQLRAGLTNWQYELSGENTGWKTGEAA